MKKTKVLLAGALVLALGLVMGCKQNTDLSVEEHRQDGTGKHIWEAEYTGNSYIRSALQFREDTNVATAKVKVTMTYPAYGKAGLLFAVQDREQKYDFYAFAFGWNGKLGNQSKIEAYVDYYQGLTTFNDSSTNSERFGNGAHISVVTNEEFKEPFNWDGAEPVIVDMYVTYNKPSEEESTETTTQASGNESAQGTYDLKITKSNDPETVYWEKTGITAVGKEMASNMSQDLIVNGEGKLYSYGMLSGQKDPKKVHTTWVLDTAATKSAE